MKQMKRLISTLLALTMIVGLMPVVTLPAAAAATVYTTSQSISASQYAGENGNVFVKGVTHTFAACGNGRYIVFYDSGTGTTKSGEDASASIDTSGTLTVHFGQDYTFPLTGSNNAWVLNYEYDSYGDEISFTQTSVELTPTYTVKVKKSTDSTYTTLYEGVELPLGSTGESSDYGINIVSPYVGDGIYYVDGTDTSSSNTSVVELGSGEFRHHMCIKGEGTTTITYTGAPPFDSNTATYQFNIKVEGSSASTTKDISGCTISVADVTYNGAEHKQTVTVVDGSTTLTENTDYSVSYPDSDYTNAGTKNITITGMGGYSGSTTKTYAINQAAGSINYASGTLKKYLGKDGAFTNTLTKTGDGTVSYGSSDTAVATVASDGKVTIVGAGSATITATVTDGANYAYATKTASYTLNVWEPKLISVDTHITEDSLPSGTVVNTAGWTVTAYYAAKDTALPAENDTDEEYNFAADPNWHVESGVTPFKVNGNAPKNETIGISNRSFIVTYSTAPAETVTIPLSPYTLTADSPNGEVIFTVGDAETDGAYEGQTPVTVTVTPDDGYTVTDITAKCGDDSIALEGTGNTRTFTMPAGDVKITVTYNEDQYAITASAAENGTFTATVNSAEAEKAAPGSVVMINPTPAEGYGLKGITVTKTGSDPVEYVDDFGTGFVMPDYAVTVSADFEQIPTDTATAWRLLNAENYPAGSTLYTGRYYLTDDAAFDGSAVGNGLKIANGATVYIYLNDHTLSATGKAANGMTGGFAGIYLPKDATIYFVGDGAVNAVGGNAAAGTDGQKGTAGYAYASCSDGLAGYLGGTHTSARGGKGGAGGNGGGGAGAGIGTNGTNGVTASNTTEVKTNNNTPAEAGTVNLLGNVSLDGSKGGENGANGAKGENGADQKKTDSFKRWPFKTKKCSAFGGGGAGGSGGQGGFGGAIVGAGGKGGNGGAKGGNGNSATTSKNHNASASAATAAGTNSASSVSTAKSVVQYYLRGVNADTTVSDNVFAVGMTLTGAEGDVLDTLTLKAYYTKTASDKMTNYGGDTDTDWAAIDVPQDKVNTVSLTNQTNADGAIVAGGNNILVSYDPGSVSDPITTELNVAGEQKNTQFIGAAGDYKDVKTVKFTTYDNKTHKLTALFDFNDDWNATYAVLYTPYHTFKDNKVTNKDGSAAPAEFVLTTPYANANNWLLGGADSADRTTYFAETGKVFGGAAYADATAYSAWLSNYADFDKIQVKNAGLYTVYERVLDWQYGADGKYTAAYKYNTYYILIEQADLGIDQATDSVYENTKVQDHKITRFVEGENGEQVYGTFLFDASYGALWGNDENLVVNKSTPIQSGLQWEFNIFGNLAGGVADQYTDSDRTTVAYGTKNLNNYLCQNDGQSAVDQLTAGGSDVQNTYYSAANGVLSYRNQETDPDPAPTGVNVIPAAMDVTVAYVGSQSAATADNAKKTVFDSANFSSGAVASKDYPNPTYATKSEENTLTSVYAEDIKISGGLTTEGIGWRVVKGDKISGATSYGTQVTAAPAYTEDLIDGDAYKGDLYVITVKAGDEIVLVQKYTDTTAKNTVSNVLSKLTAQVYDELPACEYYGVDAYEVTVEYYGLYYTTEASVNARKADWCGEEEFQWVISGVRFFLDVEQREVTLKDTGDFDKIYDGTTKLVAQTVTDGDVTAAAKYVVELASTNGSTQFAHKPTASLYNYLDPTNSLTNTMHLEIAGDYADKNKGVDKNITVAAARLLAVDDAVAKAGDKVDALNYKLVDANGETDGIAVLTGDVDVAQLHFTHNAYGTLTVYDLTPMHEAFGIHAKAYLLTATADEDGFYTALDMAETELTEKDDAKGGLDFTTSDTDYDYELTYDINTTLKYDQYLTDKTLKIDNATGAVTHVAERSIGSTNPANFPAMDIAIANFKNFTLVSADTADVNLNVCERLTAVNTKTSSAESWQHVMRFKVKGNSNNYDLLLPENQLNARPAPSVFVNRTGGTVADASAAESYKFVSVYPNGDSVLFDFTIPQDSYLKDVKIVAVKVGGEDYKTYDNATTAVPTFETLAADTENVIGTFLTQADIAVEDDPATTDVDETVAAGMNNVANALYLDLLQVNGVAATAFAEANDQVGGSTFRFELRTGECDLGENYAIAVVPVIEKFGKLVDAAATLTVEQKYTSTTDATMIDGANDTVYVNYKTLLDTSAYGGNGTVGDGYITMSYGETTKTWTLGANAKDAFNSFAINTEAAGNKTFFNPETLLPGTVVSGTVYVWRNGAAATIEAATADDADVFDTATFTWTVSQQDYEAMFGDDVVTIRNTNGVIGYATVTGATFDLSNLPVYLTNHAISANTADAKWSVQTGFDAKTVYGGTWYTDAAFTTPIEDTTAIPANTDLYLKVASSSGGGGGGSSTTTYAPVISDGRVTVTPTTAKSGDQVTITVKPDAGYTVDTITVKDANGNEVKLTKVGENTYTYTQPASAVTIDVTYKPNTWFVDVPDSSYYYDAVKWAVDNGITTGTSETTFSPNASCTRAHMVTFIWRAAGMPEPKTTTTEFTDLDANAYYYKAVLWAAENGITLGTSDTTFSPDDTVTRGQSVTFLFRALSGTAGESNPFTDVVDGAFYFNAVKWAVDDGITNGTSDTTFSPKDDCLRAQIVTFLYRAYTKA